MPVVNACSQKCWQQQQATKSRFAEEPFTFSKFQIAAKSKQLQKNKKTENAQYLRTARTGCFYSYLASQEKTKTLKTMSRFLVLSICVLFVAVSAALVSAQSSPTVSSSSMAPPPAIGNLK